MRQFLIKPTIAIIGCGLSGTAAAYYLTKMGARVLLIGNNKSGGSVGFSRIIRQTAYENADIFPQMVVNSNLGWQEICRQSSNSEEPILQPRNSLIIGNNSAYITPAIAAAQASQVDHQVLDSTNLQKLYPFLNAKSFRGINEMPLNEKGEGAAILNPARAIEAMQKLILQNGGEIISANIAEITEHLDYLEIRASDGRKIIA